MITEFTNKIVEARDSIVEQCIAIEERDWLSYEKIFNIVVKTIGKPLDPERITMIDHGYYQGCQVFVVGGDGYQPSDYWYTHNYYGSCSGCDALEVARDLEGEERESAFFQLALNMAQRLKAMDLDEQE